MSFGVAVAGSHANLDFTSSHNADVNVAFFFG